jgi:hypothetical protein
MKISNYQIWQLRQTLRRNWIMLCVILIIPVSMGALYLYSYAPLIGEVARRERVMDNAIATIAPLLDQHLEAYIARLSPDLQRAGFDPSKFADKSLPPSKSQNRDGTYTGGFTVSRTRTLETSSVLWKRVLSVSATIDSHAQNVERDMIAGAIWISTHLRLRMEGQTRCAYIGELLLAAVARPVRDDKAAQIYDSFVKNPAARLPIRSSLDQACGSKLPYTAPASRIGIDGNLWVEPEQGFVAVAGDYKRWNASVSNFRTGRLQVNRR